MSPSSQLSKKGFNAYAIYPISTKPPTLFIKLRLSLSYELNGERAKPTYEVYRIHVEPFKPFF